MVPLIITLLQWEFVVTTAVIFLSCIFRWNIFEIYKQIER